MMETELDSFTPDETSRLWRKGTNSYFQINSHSMKPELFRESETPGPEARIFGDSSILAAFGKKATAGRNERKYTVYANP